MSQDRVGWYAAAYRRSRVRRVPLPAHDANMVRETLVALRGRRVTVTVASDDGRKVATGSLVGELAACFTHGFLVEGSYREFFTYVDVFAGHVQVRVVA